MIVCNSTYGIRSLRLYLAVLLIGATFTVAANAQNTKVKGRVTDADSGEGLPFAAVFYKGTTIGVSTDLDGYYTIETRDSTISVLCASLLGYETEEQTVRRGTFSEVNFSLKLVSSALNAAVVKPDNRYMKWILNQIDRHRQKNDPERKEAYLCDVYTKMELDLTNADEHIQNKLIRKNFGFVFDYMDTSVVSGQPYLPVMISETKAKRYHSSSPNVDRETIIANRVSGLNEDNAVSQFTGSMHLKTNFYNNFINAFNVQIPSPLSPGGDTYYDYYLIDSLMVDGRKTWKIRFHPGRGVSSSVFDGEMAIDAQDFGLKSMHAKLMKGANVNWIRSLVIDREDTRIGDSTWFYSYDNLYVDFSVTMRDSSKFISFLGNRQITYSDPVIGEAARPHIRKSGSPVDISHDAGRKDEEWWAQARPYKLSEKEQNIYKMVDSIKTVPLYNNIYNIVNTAINGYFETKYVGFGPYSRMYSFNSIEGDRFLFGLRTTSELSRKFRVGGYVAYGTRDKEFKGAGTLEWMLSRQPTRKLTFTVKRDMDQLGKGTDAFSETSLVGSILRKKNSEKRSPVNEYSARYEWEAAPWLNTSTEFGFKRIYSNVFVPMNRIGDAVLPDGKTVQDTSAVNSVGSNYVHVTARFSKNETVTRGIFTKSYLHTDYPVVTLDVLGSLKGIGRNEYSYFRTELGVNYNLRLPPAGVSEIRFTLGKIIGTVPYPMLKLHEGNGTYILDRSSFACMGFYEFASDTWTTLFWEHNFGGFFFGKIPLVKHLHWREVVTLRAAYGTLSEKNNGIVGNRNSIHAPMIFPEGMTALSKPYVEMGVGVSNIFNLIRVDTFWRMTHRKILTPEGNRIKSPECFVVNIGLELRF